jgi:hypothetical protein
VYECWSEAGDEGRQDQQRDPGAFEGRSPTARMTHRQDNGEGLDHLDARCQKHRADEDDRS